MATKFGLADGIPERRVRPIWDAIDSRQFKAAFKLSVALLAKHPHSPYALALKALVLERLGKPDEALSVCLNAKDIIFVNNVHVDDLTLSTLQIVLQRLDRLDLATSCYEHACGKYPNNLEIMLGLFNCYVREYAYVKQQQMAIKMYKIVGEERFLLWAVCSIQLQVCCNNGGEKLLSLAEALLKKHIASHGLHEPEALLTYISVLEQQGKYTAALDVISGNLGSFIGIKVDKLRIEGGLLARVHDFAAAAEIFQKVLELCPDDWTAFLHYLGCLLQYDAIWSKEGDSGELHTKFQQSRVSNLSEEVFDLRMESASLFVKKLQKDVDNAHPRCPYLASIEIEKQRRLFGKAADGKLMEALIEYVERFGYLSCFMSDVQSFIDILSEDEKSELIEVFVKYSGSIPTTSVKGMSQSITVFKMQDMLGVFSGSSLEVLEATGRKMVEMFCENLPLSKDLDPQENIHGEDLLSLASNVLVQLYWRTNRLGYLLEAILVLEFGLTIRRDVWQYKLLLVHLYSFFGALPSALEWYVALDIKNILLETVSHHIVPQMLTSPFWLETAELLSDYTKFMSDHLREAADLTFLAYRHRNYSRVIEFVKFKERLQHSHQYSMARLDAVLLQLKQKADNLEDVESVLENINFGRQVLEFSSKEELKLLTFNEDFLTRPWWSPTPEKNLLSEPFHGKFFAINPSGEQESLAKKVLERKSLLPRMLHLSLQAVSLPSVENPEPRNGASGADHHSELKILLDRFARNLGFPLDDVIKVIGETANDQYTFKDHNSSEMLHWLTCAIFLNAWHLGSRQMWLGTEDQKSIITSGAIESVIEKYISQQYLNSPPLLTNPGSNFSVLVQLLTEHLSWHILIIQSHLRTIIPFGKKKKKTSAVEHPYSPQLQSISKSIEMISRTIRNVQNWLSTQIDKSEDENLDVLLSLLNNNDASIEGPRKILEILETNASSPSPDSGERISDALRCWNSVRVTQKVIGGQRMLISRFYRICDSKLKQLESMKQSLSS